MKNKIRVLFIGPYPPPYSGPELGMKQFLESPTLNEAFEISFIRTNVRKSNENKGKFGLPMILGFFSFFGHLFYNLMFSKTQIVYYPVTPTEIGWLGRDALTILLSKMFRKKVIIHMRGSHFKLNYSRFSSFGKKITSFALRRVDKAIVQANYLRDQFSPYVSLQNTAVLYQAIDTGEYHNKDLGEYEKGALFSMGHMTKAKGFTDILKAIPEVVDKHSDAQFYFAGNIRKGERGVFFNQLTNESIEYEDPFEAEDKIQNSGYADHYHNMGIVKGEDKIERLRKSQIYITCSYSEGFSRALLEAMSVGKPLIFTPVGAHREVLKDGVHGVCVEPGNTEEIIKAISYLLKNEDVCAQMAINNYREARQKYSKEIIANELKSIIESVLL